MYHTFNGEILPVRRASYMYTFNEGIRRVIRCLLVPPPRPYCHATCSKVSRARTSERIGRTYRYEPVPVQLYRRYRARLQCIGEGHVRTPRNWSVVSGQDENAIFRTGTYNGRVRFCRARGTRSRVRPCGTKGHVYREKNTPCWNPCMISVRARWHQSMYTSSSYRYR